jgi:glycerol-3-phosphate dehydrogenase subunit B
MNQTHDMHCDLLIIGAGMTGMAAAVFAANRKIETVLVGITSEMIFASGLLDLLGVYPIERGKSIQDPWQGIADLCIDNPDHPYAKIPASTIQKAFEELVAFMNASGQTYARHRDRNAFILTPAGTLKPSYYIPQTMWGGVQAYESKAPCLIIDINGLKGFNARQITAPFKDIWPDLAQTSISYPGLGQPGELYLEPLARAMVIPQNRQVLADTIRPLINGYQYVGLPAMFGIQNPDDIRSDLEKQLGAKLFEIPTMPPSIPGLRLKETFETALPQEGIRCLVPKQVLAVDKKGSDFLVQIGDSTPEQVIKTRGIILASGRFVGRGLHADRMKIRESIFNLPVHQPEKRREWHRFEFLHPSGHPINRAGLEIDEYFRPLDASGQAAHDALFTAGSILAHQDWVRSKCGSGLAIATAFAAVNAFINASSS